MDWLGRSLTSYFLWVSAPGLGRSHGFRRPSGVRGCERAEKGDFLAVRLVWAWQWISPPGGSERLASGGMQVRAQAVSLLKAEALSS